MIPCNPQDVGMMELRSKQNRIGKTMKSKKGASSWNDTSLYDNHTVERRNYALLSSYAQLFDVTLAHQIHFHWLYIYFKSLSGVMGVSDDWLWLLQHRIVTGDTSDPGCTLLCSAPLRYSAFPPACSRCRRPMTAADGGHRDSYLLDGFESRDCGERRGRHFPHVHVHVAAVLAHGQRWIFFRHVLGLLDIFCGLFHLRLAVDNRVGHFIQVMSIPLAENCGGAWCCWLFLQTPSSF